MRTLTVSAVETAAIIFAVSDYVPGRGGVIQNSPCQFWSIPGHILVEEQQIAANTPLSQLERGRIVRLAGSRRVGHKCLCFFAIMHRDVFFDRN